ncbi:MAG: Mov34/MPN/PAD-1 family protein [Thermoplasmata archaeon]|nr:MAG: Mov34/MPN/PAD-1 family protein [Thermoplasmata archaeon]
MQEVIIDPRCFFALITSSLEVYNRETTGLLVGNFRMRKMNGSRKRKKVIVLEAAYPFQTAKRKPTWVDIGNFEAFQRARASLHSLNFSMVGEFHSHPNRSISLSDADVRYIRERVQEIYYNGNSMLNHHWLELVISVRKREYSQPQKTGWTWRKYKNKLSCIIKTNPYLGYKFTLAGFWVSIDEDDKRKVEAKLYFPDLIRSIQSRIKAS